MSPRVSVVVPVFNRPSLLRRALDSIAAQTFADLECVVVDDGSDEDPQEVVRLLGDQRFRMVRRPVNGGTTAARTDGFRETKGEFVTTLDSDNEMFPWALERAVSLLDQTPEVSVVTGLYVFPDGLKYRVTGGSKIVGPEDHRNQRRRGGWDSLAVVRRDVVEEWLSHRSDYFNLDFHLWFIVGLRFCRLLVDEPWGKYHMDATDRITDSPDPRHFADPVKFVEEYRAVVGTEPSEPLDSFLREWSYVLRRASRNAERKVVEEWMRDRDIKRRNATAEALRRRVARFRSGSAAEWI